MIVTSTQIVKQYSITTNQTIKQTKVTSKKVSKDFSITIASLGKRGFQGEPGQNYTDIELIVTQDNQTEFNIFTEPELSNLIVNDCTFFKDKSYLIQNISGSWKLIWLNEFSLAPSDLLIFRKI